MVKRILVVLEDAKYKTALKRKGKKTWEQVVVGEEPES